MPWINSISVPDLKMAASVFFTYDNSENWDGEIELIAHHYLKGAALYLNSSNRKKSDELFTKHQEGLVEKRYWESFKLEFQLFLCTKDRRYSKLRKKLDESSTASTTVILSTISAAMAEHVGISAGVLVPFTAICIYSILRVGKEALCLQLQSGSDKSPANTNKNN